MKTLIVIPALLAFFLLSGCASYGDEALLDYGPDWPPLNMTKTELMRKLGPPRMRTVSNVAGHDRRLPRPRRGC